MRYVVIEYRVGLVPVWAWCLSDGQVGFVSVTYTEPGGLVLIDPPEAAAFQKVLFTVPAVTPDGTLSVEEP